MLLSVFLQSTTYCSIMAFITLLRKFLDGEKTYFHDSFSIYIEVLSFLKEWITSICS